MNCAPLLLVCLTKHARCPTCDGWGYVQQYDPLCGGDGCGLCWPEGSYSGLCPPEDCPDCPMQPESAEGAEGFAVAPCRVCERVGCDESLHPLVCGFCGKPRCECNDDIPW